MEFILASQSPRRQELLARMGLKFSAHPADIDEVMVPGLPPEEQVAQISRRKALAVEAGPEAVVIAADTIVVLDGQILGKPRDPAHARQMLRALSGRTHQVMTGCTVRRGEGLTTFTETTVIHFRPLTDREIEAYVASGEPMDKAGAYGIQGGAALFIPAIEGDYYNVMGLPLCRLFQVLGEEFPDFRL